jgi:hypothetical protein
MDKAEARALLDREIARLRERSYAELRARIPAKRRRFLFIEVVDAPQVDSHQVTGDSGAIYQVETEVFWDDKAHETIRVFASIDDGGRPAFMPMTAAFILAPDGGFVGE